MQTDLRAEPSRDTETAASASGAAGPQSQPETSGRSAPSIDILSLDEVLADPARHRRRGRPLLMRTDDLTRQASLQERLTADHLRRALGGAAIVLLQGRDARGASRRREKTTVADLLAPLDHGRPSGLAYTSVMFNEDRTTRVFDGCVPDGVEPWTQMLATLPIEPRWPLALLQEDAPPDGGEPPHVNTSATLSVGYGYAAPYHKHAANLYLQVHGSKQWRIIEPTAFEPFLHPTEPQGPGPFCLNPDYAEIIEDFQRPWPAVAAVPAAMSFVTTPGDMLYIPRGWVHATWSLDPYTAAITKHNDR